MVQNLHKDPQGINKNNKEVKKDRPTQVSIDINKNNKEVKKDRHKGIRLTVRISDEEYQYYSLMLSIFNGLTVNGKPVFGKFLSMPSFCKTALRFICNTYRDNLFTDQGTVKKMNDVDTFIKFIKFRDKYMKNPNNNQI